MSKAARLRKLIFSDELEFICEAHNGISSRIVEEAGFKGIWGSGLSLAAQFGVRDNNEASWTQVLEMLEFMSDASTIPILFDGDTGYGNFNNMQRLVRKLEQRDIAGICIEDKCFPKRNSFISGHTQALADIDEFCGKIKAGKDAQTDDDFCIVARVEALIAGWGMDEALRRASDYHEAGADAVLIHSSLSKPDQVIEFMKHWGDRGPVVIVPTKYYSTPTDVFREHHVSLVIWANHILRSSIHAMQKTADDLFREQNLMSINDSIASLDEVFRLQSDLELREAEKRYMPDRRPNCKVVILAASRGIELGELTENRPKTMVSIGDRSILEIILASYRRVGLNDIYVVRGYCKDRVNIHGVTYVDNDEYDEHGELLSLKKALDSIMEKDEERSDMIVAYGDVLFNRYIPQLMLDDDAEISITVDTNWQESANRNRQADYVNCSAAYSRLEPGAEIVVRQIADELPQDSVHGEWMGMIRIAASRLETVYQAVIELLTCSDIEQEKMTSLINRLVATGENVRVLYTSGHWLDVDRVEDVGNAVRFM